MTKIIVTDGHGEFEGWIDRDAAVVVAAYNLGFPIKCGKMLLATPGGRLVISSWDANGDTHYRLAESKAEIAEILARSSFGIRGGSCLAALAARYEL